LAPRSYRGRIGRILELKGEINKGELRLKKTRREISDRQREQAELMWRIKDEKQATHVQIAEQTGYDKSYISVMTRAWKKFEKESEPTSFFGDFVEAVKNGVEPEDGLASKARREREADQYEPKTLPEKVEAANKLLSDPQVAAAVENSRASVPRHAGLQDAIDSTHVSDRVTGPLSHLRNVAWKTSRKVAEVTRFRKDEREELTDTASELRFYADLYEGLGRESIDPDDFASQLEARE
jgi:hypothetical protein